MNDEEIEAGQLSAGGWDIECGGCNEIFYIEPFSPGLYRCPYCHAVNGVDWEESYEGYDWWNWLAGEKKERPI